MKKLKVLTSAYAFNPIVSSQLHPGEDLIGWNLVGQLNRFHDVWVIAHSYNQDAAQEALENGAMKGVNISFVNLPRWMRLLYKIEFGQRIYYYLWQIKAWLTARKLHKEIQFDMAHHLTFGNDWIPSFIGAFLPVPFVWGPVGGGQRTPKELMKEYSKYGLFAEYSRRMAQWIGRHLYTRWRCAKRAKAILVCNRETRDKFPDKLKHKIQYFPVNGISEEDLNPEDGKVTEHDKFQILSAGRLQRLKGFALAIRAFAIFSEKHPDSELTIVGEGPEQERLEALIRDLGLEEKVRIHPWILQEELLRMMRECEVFLFPSFRDGGGAVVVEAMAQGRPVVCLDAAGPGFHIQKDWGIKVAPARVELIIEEIASGLERLYEDKTLRTEMGSAALRRAKEYYVWDRLGERLLAIYQLAVNSKQ